MFPFLIRSTRTSCRRSLSHRNRLALSYCGDMTTSFTPTSTTSTHQSSFSTESSTGPSIEADKPISPSRYAVVDHSEAYEEAMRGAHGSQLELAQLEGVGKDDPPFNPFLEEELEEERERLEAEAEMDDEDEGDEAEMEEEEEEEEDDEEDEAEGKAVKLYKNDGSLRWKKSQLAAFRAGAPAGGMFAVIQLAGSQHKVTTDDLLVVNLLKPVETYKVGSVHTFSDNVMLVGSSHMTMVGMPYVTGAEVDVMVEEITQDAKVIVFKKRRRKNYKRKKGHRRDVTFLRILDIRPPKEYADHKHVQRETPTP